MKTKMHRFPLAILALFVFGPGLAAQDEADLKKKLDEAQTEFKAKNYAASLKLAQEVYTNAGGMEEPGSLSFAALLLVAKTYAATGDYRTASLSFLVMTKKAKDPAEKRLAVELKSLMTLVIANAEK